MDKKNLRRIEAALKAGAAIVAVVIALREALDNDPEAQPAPVGNKPTEKNS